MSVRIGDNAKQRQSQNEKDRLYMQVSRRLQRKILQQKNEK